MEHISDFYTRILATEHIIYGTWSNPRLKSNPISKVTCKSIILKDEVYLQFASLQDKKELHKNVLYTEVASFLATWITDYKQLNLFTDTADYQVLVNKKGMITLKKSAPTKQEVTPTKHNREKEYLLDATNASDFLMELGLMGKDGQIKPTRYSKYKQINKYLEMMVPVLPELPNEGIRIIDFGCGKSYLTFAMYYYFTEILHKKVEVIGLDLKEDVITHCTEIAQKLGYAHLHFQKGDIGHYTTDKTVDMVVSLHACNTATDAALAKAVQWNAKVILAVPCCHHECYTQIENETLAPILQHGILKEKIAALLTDGLRAQLLISKGYKVQVVEFIDTEHTPKNILIRAVANQLEENPQAKEAYDRIAELLHLQLSLEKMLF